MNKRDKAVSVYLSEDEKKALQRRADELGVSFATYLRMLLLADVRHAASEERAPAPPKPPQKSK